MSKYDYAKLRPVDVNPFVHEGQSMLYLHDPLALSPQMACLPQALGYVLALFNGQRTVEEVRHLVR